MTGLVLLATVWAAATGNITLSEMLELSPSKATREHITQVFGKPDNVNTFKDPAAGQSWEYRRDGLVKLTVFFQEGSETARSWDWGVGSRDPEIKLKAARALFPSATWTVETTKWINPHAAPDECYYRDGKLGVSLEYRIQRKEVFRISRWNPERKLASDEGDKPPQYCMGIEPNTGCTPAIPAEKFFATMGMSVAEYCEETKK